MKSRLYLLLTGISACAALCLQTSTVEAVFASVKSTGMAATAISYPLDTFAGAYNPAGLTDVGDRFDLEAAFVVDSGTATFKNNFELNTLANVEEANYNGMKTKIIVPVGFGLNKNWCLNEDWKISTGVILYNRAYQKTTYKKAIPLFGQTKQGLEYLNETISPIVGIQWCDSHTLAISANYQLERIKVNGLENFDNPLFSSEPGFVTNKGYNYSNGWGLTVGYLGHWTNKLSIGVTYQPETTMNRMDKYKGFLAQHGRLNIPRKIGAGISYWVLPCVIVAFDVEQLQWSKIKSLHNPLLNNGVLEQLGTTNGPGFGFRDQWFYRAGIEWTINDMWTLRAGYRYANTPIRKSQTAVNILTLDTVQSFITAGATWNYNECNEISFVGAWGFQNTISGTNVIPPALGGGDVSIKEQKYAIGVAWGYKY